MQTLLEAPADVAQRQGRGAQIVLCGGVTGGHLIPGLAVADELQWLFPDATITFVGAGKAWERRLVHERGYEYMAVACRPKPESVWGTWEFVSAQWSGYRAARQFLDQRPTDVVIGLGGYASAPMARAALRANVPLVLLEQNVIAGRATKWLASEASLVCAAFPEVRRQLRSSSNLRITGNPLRRAFSQLAREQHAHRSPCRRDVRRVVVLGGSQGAAQLNESVPRALYKAGAAQRGWSIVHQSGEPGQAATRALYRKLGLRAIVAPFIEPMAELLAATDLVVSRAGGTALAEFAAAGVPAVLLPYPHSRDRHQARNAEYFARSGAAVVVDTRAKRARVDDACAASVVALADDRAKRVSMREAMLRQARPHASAHVAEMVGELLALRRTG